MARYDHDHAWGYAERGYPWPGFATDYGPPATQGQGRYGERGEYRYGAAGSEEGRYHGGRGGGRSGWQGRAASPQPGRRGVNRGAFSAGGYGSDYTAGPIGRGYASDFLGRRSNAPYGADYDRAGQARGPWATNFARRYGR